MKEEITKLITGNPYTTMYILGVLLVAIGIGGNEGSLWSALITLGVGLGIGAMCSAID